MPSCYVTVHCSTMQAFTRLLVLSVVATPVVQAVLLIAALPVCVLLPAWPVLQSSSNASAARVWWGASASTAKQVGVGLTQQQLVAAICTSNCSACQVCSCFVGYEVRIMWCLYDAMQRCQCCALECLASMVQDTCYCTSVLLCKQHTSQAWTGSAHKANTLLLLMSLLCCRVQACLSTAVHSGTALQSMTLCRPSPSALLQR